MNLNDSPNLKLPCPSSQRSRRERRGMPASSKLPKFLWGGRADQGQYVWGSGGFYASVFNLPEGGEEENDGAASSRSRLVEYQLHFQQLRASGVYILKYVMGSKPKLCL